MSCTAGRPTFRLLDHLVGWDISTLERLEGQNDRQGLRLAGLDPNIWDDADVDTFLPPPLLARSCRPCVWFLATPAPPRSRLLMWNPCGSAWRPVMTEDANPLLAAVSIATHRHSIAVTDAAANRIWVFDRDGERIAARIEPAFEAGPIAFTPDGDLLVAHAGTGEIYLFTHGGGPLGQVPAVAPKPIHRIATGTDCSIWIASRHQGGFAVWRNPPGSQTFISATPEDAAKILAPSGVVASTAEGFCIDFSLTPLDPHVLCFDWYGRPLEQGLAPVAPQPVRHTQGQLLTVAINSGIPRCRWHRIRVDATIPTGTSVEVAVSTSEAATPQAQGRNDAAWSAFADGLPHPIDWQAVSADRGALDFLVRRPPGQYLFLRLRLTGDGRSTPFVRRIRCEFPRSTSLERLPAVYRANRDAEDFAERFLALFDAQVEELDRAIERAPSLLDSQLVDPDALPWLASLLDMVFDPGWGLPQRRAILKILPDLFRRRGTAAGMLAAIRAVFGVEAVLTELADERMWGALAQSPGRTRQNAGSSSLPPGLLARLNSVRLFSRSRARFTLGSSGLGKAPINSYGNADLDPHSSLAWRFKVLAPGLGEYGPVDEESLLQLVNAQKPAHTVATVVRSSRQPILGYGVALGIDTYFTAVQSAVLNTHGRLGHDLVLAPGPRGRNSGLIAGRMTPLGICTSLE